MKNLLDLIPLGVEIRVHSDYDKVIFHFKKEDFNILRKISITDYMNYGCYSVIEDHFYEEVVHLIEEHEVKNHICC